MTANNTTLKKEHQSKLNNHPVKNFKEITLKTYSHEDFGQIRGLMQDDDLWVAAKEVAKALGYSETNAMTRQLDDDEFKSFRYMSTNMLSTFISEAGLYSAIIRSRVEGAKRFKRWITHEILPSIRKYCFYGTDNYIDNIIADQSVRLSSFKKYKDDRQRRRSAEQQRDEAVEAINLKNREIEYLKWQLDEPHTWTPVREIPWVKDFFKIDKGRCTNAIGKSLSNESKQLGLNPRRVKHPKWGTVNIYHTYVIQRFHGKLIKDPNYMKRFRKF